MIIEQEIINFIENLRNNARRFQTTSKIKKY